MWRMCKYEIFSTCSNFLHVKYSKVSGEIYARILTWIWEILY